MTEKLHNHAHDEEVVRVSCVRHTYEDGVSVHLCGLDFLAHAGHRVAVLGPNGAGKTTLLFHILGLLTPQEGSVEVFGKDPSREWPSIRRKIGVLLQNVEEQLLAPSVRDDVAFSPRQYGLPEEDVTRLVDRALGLLDIRHLADRVPQNLSGGEKRKVALAGALVMEPDLLVLDEPFEGLDPRSREELLRLMERLSRENGTTIVLSTHDIDTVPLFADYAYILAPGGKIALHGTPEEVFSAYDAMAEANIEPPILSELFARLRQDEVGAPETPLTVSEAADALVRWKRED